MRDKEYHVGPGAVSLLLVIVVVSLSVLGLLALISARGDYKLTERSAAFAVAENEASALSEKSVAELDGILCICMSQAEDNEAYLAAVKDALPEGYYMEENVISWEECVSGGRTLSCEIEIMPLDGEQRFEWKTHMFLAQELLLAE